MKLYIIDIFIILIWFCLIVLKRVIVRFLICEIGVRMCEGYVEKLFYLLIVEWMMVENRWVIVREIFIYFDIEYSKAVNILIYILSEVIEISCEVKMIFNKLEGRGC